MQKQVSELPVDWQDQDFDKITAAITESLRLNECLQLVQETTQCAPKNIWTAMPEEYETWLEFTQSLAHGILQLEILADNPEWAEKL